MSSIRALSRLAVADAKAHPRRTLLVAGLLVLAAVVPWSAPGLTLPLLVAAGAVVVAVAALARESHRADLTVLDLNGMGRGSRPLLAMAAVAVPGLVAFVPALVAALVAAGSGSTAVVGVVSAVVWVTLLLPPIAAGVLSVASATSPTARRGWRQVARIALVIVLVPFVPIGTALAFAFVWWWRRDRPPSRWGVVLSVATIILVALLLGSQSSWTDANILSFVLLPALAAAVARLSTAVLAGLSRSVAARRADGRLATAPVLVRRRAYGPLVAMAALVLTAVTIQAVLGAGLGAREAQREEALIGVDQRAGLNDHQLLVHTALEQRDIDRFLREAERRWGAGSAAAIDPTGVLSGQLFDIFGTQPDGGALAARRGLLVGPRSVAIVEPQDLVPLGLAAHTDDLVAGRALILNPALGSDDEVAIVDDAGPADDAPLRLPGVRVSTDRIAHELPGVLVSQRTAVEAAARHPGTLFEGTAWSAASVRPVTLVLALDHEPSAEDRSTAARFARSTTPRPDLDDLRSSGAATRSTEVARPSSSTTILPEALMSTLLAYDSSGPEVASGGAPAIDERGDGPLNETAFAGARSWEASRGSLLVGTVLALVIVVIVAVLANGLARDEDEVIELQGGAPNTRRRLSAMQAGLLGGAASAVAALVGIGAVGLGIANYNSARWEDVGFQDPRPLPAIPFHVPWPVIVVLLAVPVLAAVASAAITAMAPRPDARPLSSRLG